MCYQKVNTWCSQSKSNGSDLPGIVFIWHECISQMLTVLTRSHISTDVHASELFFPPCIGLFPVLRYKNKRCWLSRITDFAWESTIVGAVAWTMPAILKGKGLLHSSDRWTAECHLHTPTGTVFAPLRLNGRTDGTIFVSKLVRVDVFFFIFAKFRVYVVLLLQQSAHNDLERVDAGRRLRGQHTDIIKIW